MLIADFNADGKTDLPWRHSTTGQLYIWLMNGLNARATASPGIVDDLGWQIELIGDFNNDSKADLLWRHSTTGQLYGWLMNGTDTTVTSCPGTVSDMNWKIQK